MDRHWVLQRMLGAESDKWSDDLDWKTYRPHKVSTFGLLKEDAVVIFIAGCRIVG